MKDVSTVTLYTFKWDIVYKHTTDIEVLKSWIVGEVIMIGAHVIIDEKEFEIVHIMIEPSIGDNSYLNPVYGLLIGNPYQWRIQTIITIEELSE